MPAHDPKEYYKVWRENRKKKGLCRGCHRKADGKLLCKICKKKQNNRQKIWRLDRFHRKLCSRCSNTVTKFKTCLICREKNNNINKARYDRLKKENR